MIAAVLGVLKAGGAYLPLEPALPADRVAGMLADAGCSLVLSTPDTERWALPDGVRLVELTAARSPGPDHDPEPAAGPDNTAYIIFTSGSTGKPKGVAVTHRPVHNLLMVLPHFRVRPRRRRPVRHVARLRPLRLRRRPARLRRWRSHRGRCPAARPPAAPGRPAHGTDHLLGLGAHHPQPGRLLVTEDGGYEGTDDLRLVFLSGDYTPLSLPDEVRRVFTGAEIVSLGGATEATVWSNYFRVREIDPAWRSIPYGRPIDNARYDALDEKISRAPSASRATCTSAGTASASATSTGPS